MNHPQQNPDSNQNPTPRRPSVSPYPAVNSPQAPNQPPHPGMNFTSASGQSPMNGATTSASAFGPAVAQANGQANATSHRSRARRRGLIALGTAAGLSLMLVGGGFAAQFGANAVSAITAQEAPLSAAGNGGSAPLQGQTGGSTGGSTGGGNGSAGGFGNGANGGTGSSGGTSNGSGGGADGTMPGADSTQTDATPASAKESTGVVLIDTKLGYQSAEAAGTGIVLSSDGLILTNNHVIADSTEIKVTVATTGKTYTAKVLGSDSTKDVAVLQLKDASGLQTAKVDNGDVKVGADVTAVGNAGGTGQLAAADGTVTDLNASVTTTAESSADSESLNNMIEVDADIVAGDSGGALLDSDGDVIGIDTAASSGSANITGYAIPIDSALATAKSIVSGEQTQTNTLGYPAFLGIGVQSATDSQSGSTMTPGGQGSDQSSGQDSSGASSGSARTSSSGAVVSGVYENTPAAKAGLTAGDTITSIDSTTVSDPTTLSDVIAKHSPGDKVALTWIDASGQSHSATVTLTEGPAS